VVGARLVQPWPPKRLLRRSRQPGTVGVAYWILQQTIIAAEGSGSLPKAAVGKDLKGKSSVVAYAIAIPLAFVEQWIAGGIYVLVALVWLIPDKRIERALGYS
jgi:uncharacterized membrane protein